MPIDTSLIGTAVGPNVEEVDARWAMAYAAGLGDMQDCYMDTRREGGIIAHPMFPVCVEWQIAGKLRAKHRVTLSQVEAARGVHATQHMIFHRPIRPPMKLSTTASIEGIERRRPGPYEVVKYATVDEHGTPICTTYAGSIYREVAMNGDERPAVTPAIPVSTERSSKSLAEFTIAIPANAAHVYTECAHIWNPIHTDAAVAAGAGLPAIMLHGTATLALAVAKIIATEVGNDPERVAEIYARFGAMVFMPSEVKLRIVGREKIAGRPAIFFEAISAEGGYAVRDGAVVLRG
jgi:acyl dehydratase